jgi:hypothetical protein
MSTQKDTTTTVDKSTQRGAGTPQIAEILQRIIRVSPKLKMEVDGVTFYDTLIIKDAINAPESWKAAQ